MPFAEPLGLFALAATVPVIAAYLLRPRRIKRTVPSILFFMSEEGDNLQRFFKRFVKDILLPLQLIAIALIALALSGPYILSTESVIGGDVSLVLDASGSMGADDRFQDALELAGKYLGESNTIILARSTPAVVVEDVSPSEARRTLSHLQPSAAPADLASAILLASDRLPTGGKIVVISDLSYYKGTSPLAAVSIARSNGHEVIIEKVGNPEDNVGIVNGWLEGVSGSYTFMYGIRNYGDSPVRVTVKLKNGGKSIGQSQLVFIGAHTTEFLSVSGLPRGLTQISISPGGALATDDIANIYIPPANTATVMFEGDVASPALIALQVLPNTDVSVLNSSTTLPSLAGYDIVVLGDSTLNRDLVLRLKPYVESGGSLVVLGSERFVGNESDGVYNLLAELLPVEPSTVLNETMLSVVHLDDITQEIPFDEVSVKKIISATPKSGAITLVETRERSAVLSYWRVGEGVVVWLGLSDVAGWDDFPSKPQYPLFWNLMISWLTGAEDPQSLNRATGDILVFETETEVDTPRGHMITQTLPLDDVGVYHVDGQTYAVSMLNIYESDTTRVGDAIEPGTYGSSTSTRENVESRVELGWVPLIAFLIAVVLELYILRRRGEL